jgi:molecular chaperone GrpE
MGPDRDRQGFGEGAREAPKTGASQTPSPVPVSDAKPALPREGEEQVSKDIAELVSGLESERDEYLELARRTKADFENYRKRVDREAAHAAARGRAELAKKLLPVVDNLERALSAGETSNLVEGVRLVYEELSRVLSDAGVESYEPRGEQFDPSVHEAMMTKPAGADEAGKVLEVLEKGYRLNGQILRPARVVVGAEQQPDGFGEG